MGPGSTVTCGPSIPSAGPQGLKLEAQSAVSGGGAFGREGLLQRFVYAFYGFLLLTCQFFRSGVFFSCEKIFVSGLGGTPGARGPGSLNRLNPRFLRHCVLL